MKGKVNEVEFFIFPSLFPSTNPYINLFSKQSIKGRGKKINEMKNQKEKEKLLFVS